MPQVKEHPFRTVNKMIKSGTYPSVILLYGKERLLVDWALRSIEKAVVNPMTKQLDYSAFSEKEDDVAAIIAACETLPFMSEKKMVVLKDLAPEQIAPLADYISDMPDTTLLIIVTDKPDKRKPLYKKTEKIGLCYDFSELDEATLYTWAQKRFAAAGKDISRTELLRFANEAGYYNKELNYGLYNFENDIKKALSYYDKKEITCEDLLFLSSHDEDSNAFRLLDAAFSGKKDEALSLLDVSIKSEQPSKQQGVILRFHGLLCSQLEIMLEARERREKGQTQAQIAEESGYNAYRLKKAVEASERLTTKRLKAALSGCYRIESDIKQGRMDPRLALEMFIAKI